MSNGILTSSERSYLTKKAHNLKPVVMLGKNGLTDSLLKAVNDALESHELIKIKFVDYKESRREISCDIESKTHSRIVQIIGNVLILYKENPDPEKRKINLH